MFVIANADYAKRVAKTVEEVLHDFGISARRKSTLNLTAALWGYRNYEHLLKEGVGSDISPYDDQCEEAERARRRSVQIEAARSFGIKDGLIPEFIDRVRPTSRRETRDETAISQGFLPELLELVRFAAQSDTTAAAKLLVEALQVSDRRQKPEVVRELEQLCPIEPMACYNLGMGYFIGDAGRVDHGLVAEYMNACCAFERGDKTHALALKVLGDLEKLKRPGSDGVIRESMPYYRAAALMGHVPEAAYNCGLYYSETGDYELAADFYLTAIRGGNVYSMSNLATMILDGHYDGGSKLMRALYAEAARQGDGAAHNAMRVIDSLVRKVDFPSVAAHLSEAARYARHNPFLISDLMSVIPVREWIKAMHEKDWALSSINLKPRRDLDRIAIAEDGTGREFPVYMTCAMHVVDHVDQDVLSDFASVHGDGEAILLFNGIRTLNETTNPDDRYLCIGMIRFDDEWSDLFLEHGGLAAALKQRKAMQTNPSLNKGRLFRCNDADRVEETLRAATLKRTERL